MEEKKIILTDEEKAVIGKYFNGELNAFFMEDREREIIDEVIDKADALMKELNAYDELGNDLIKWYYNKYKAQYTKS